MPILRKDCSIRRDVEAGSAVFGEGVFTRCALSHGVQQPGSVRVLLVAPIVISKHQNEWFT